MGTMAVAMVDVSQQQATRTPRPTRTLRPTADATAAFFKQLDARQTIAVRTATAKARATQAIATFTPAPPTPTIYPVGYRAPWADKMVKRADGTWMAPKEVVTEATKHYLEYYKWFASRDRAFIALPDSIQLEQYARFFSGEVLMRRKKGLASSELDYIFVDPKKFDARVIRVTGFSADGLWMLCDLELRNIDIEVLHAATGKTEYVSRLADRIDSDLLIFDPVDRRWKWADTIASVELQVR
jgi:hypothetical protein